MADRLLIEGGVDAIQLEDLSGVVLLEGASTDVLISNDTSSIEDGVVAQTAAGLGGLLIE